MRSLLRACPAKPMALVLLSLDALAVVALGSGTLRAQSTTTTIDVERFKPAVTHDGFVAAEGSDVRFPEDRWEFGAFVNYGWRPLVVVDQAGHVTHSVVGGRLGFDLIASATLFEPVAIGVAMPFYAAQSSDFGYSSAGLGNLRLVPKVRILNDRGSGPFGLGLLLELRLPTHTGDFSGPSSVAAAPKVAIDHRFRSGLRLGGNVGVLIQQTNSFMNVQAASEFAYAVAAGYRFGGDAGKVELGAELLGGVGLSAANREEIPLELFPYVKIDPSDEWQIQAGPGVGLLSGYGVPALRFFAGLRYTPTSHDSDHDGVPDSRDRCRTEAEDRDGVHDDDGCPEEDEDSDGVPDAQDRCPNEKETINGFKDDDGCPDEGPAKVIVEQGRIRILENIRFKSGSSEIDEQSHSILDQVALTMKANKQIKRVRVEGHTDERGSHELNMRLSRERANSVRDYLVRKGVKPERLVAEGFGPDKPLSQGKDPDSLAKNRRVEFIVEQ